MASSAPDDDDPPDLIGANLPGTPSFPGIIEIVRHVAVGSMGHVYEGKRIAEDGVLQGPERVAVKVLHTRLLSMPDVAFRFRHESELLASIKSPYVPKLFARGRDAKKRPYMVLEFVDGVALSDLLAERGPLPVLEAIEIAVQICRGLGGAHAEGIVHRDMKPENTIVGGTREAPIVKVLDFSVSKSEDLELTQGGVVLGTPAYMAPEQARGQPVTPLVDVYGAGAILYEMLTGRPPVDGEDSRQMLLALLTEEPPPARVLRPDLSLDTERLVMKAIARDPKDRFPLVESFASALEVLKDELEAPAPSLPSGRLVFPTSSRRPAALLEASPSEPEGPTSERARTTRPPPRGSMNPYFGLGVFTCVALAVVLLVWLFKR